MMLGADQLTTKEKNLFKSILSLLNERHYEAKQYKKGLKNAETILKSHPKHGETLAMKGLLLNSMDRKREAYLFVRKGLKYDIRSHVCWHVLGLLYRSDRNYFESVKCYRNALRHDKDNAQILRDLASMQIQTRDYKGLLSTRNQLLIQHPKKSNWMAFAIAAHLYGDHAKSLQILNAYETTETSTGKDFDLSEMYLYKNLVIEESGDIAGALAHLEQIKDKIVDILSWKDKKVELLLKLDKLDEAEKEARELLDLNSDNLKYHEYLWRAKKLNPKTSDEDQLKALTLLYEELSSKYSDSSESKRMPLTFLKGDSFVKHFRAYSIPALIRGIPSLFQSVKDLYFDHEKVHLIEQVFLEFIQNLEKDNTLEEGAEKEPPSTLLWTLMFLSQHYCQIGNTKKALEVINRAIKHTPTVIDLYLIKARIYKKAGDAKVASEWLEYARELDLADRFLNTTSTRYLLRADLIESAEKIISLFIKDSENARHNIYDMQVMWYEQEQGSSFYRQGNYGLALKRLISISRHFMDIKEDQFDFHSYCLQKMTLRSYLSLLRLEDRLLGHKVYARAAEVIVSIYLELHDQGAQTTQGKKNVQQTTSKQPQKQTQKQPQKQTNKPNPSQPKQQQRQPQKKNQNVKKTKKWIDFDNEGYGLIQVPNPLEHAEKYVSNLLKFSSSNLKTHLLAFEVFIRKKKYLLALRAVKKASVIDPDHPDVHRAKIRFFHTVSLASGIPEQVLKVIELEQQLPSLLNGQDYKLYNQAFLDKHSASFPHRAAAAEMILIISPDDKSKSIARYLLEDTKDTNGPQLNDCIRVHKVLQSNFDETIAAGYSTRCLAIFPYATYFNNGSSSEISDHPPQLDRSSDTSVETASGPDSEKQQK